MLIRMLEGKGRGTPEERARTTQAVGIGFAVLGIGSIAVLVLLKLLRIVDIEAQVNSYTDGLLFGMSGGILGAGIATALSARRRLRDPEKMRQFIIKSTDERNQAIQNAAARLTFLTMLVLLYLAVFVCAFFWPELSAALSFGAVILMLFYFFYVGLLSKRM